MPPLPLATLAQGQAVFKLLPGGTELSYKVIASNIENVVGAHIHLAPAGLRGPLVALLLNPPPPPGGGRTDGVIAEGTLTAAGLFGPLAGQPLSALMDAIQEETRMSMFPRITGSPLPTPAPATIRVASCAGKYDKA